MHVMVVQLDMAWEDKTRNRNRVVELLATSDVPPGTLIVLPEMFETGFSMNVEATAQDAHCQGESFLRGLAVKYQSAVIGGVVSPAREDPTSGRKVASNEAVVYGPDGSELARYRKQHPFSLSGEDRCYPAGEMGVAFEWQGVRIAPFICYDLRFPELFRTAVRDGAEMFVVIACWPAVRSEHWVRLLQARAIENLALTVGGNRCGHEPKLEFDGRSAAFDHLGRCLFEADGREQILQCDLDAATMRQWRDKFPALRDSRVLSNLQ
ncbi:MAG: nitrilase-related carbon-nitrogen hydrolase [Pirellulaceae bacterium]